MNVWMELGKVRVRVRVRFLSHSLYSDRGLDPVNGSKSGKWGPLDFKE